MRYPSAKGLGFSILIGGVLLLLIVCVVIAPANLRLPIAAGAAAVTALMLWIWFGTWYEFREDYLMIRFGPFFERVPYERIVSATKLKSMVSSMALASEMIELQHGPNYISGTTYISPKDRDGFLLELKARCVNLK
jgi:hypothetical protein